MEDEKIVRAGAATERVVSATDGTPVTLRFPGLDWIDTTPESIRGLGRSYMTYVFGMTFRASEFDEGWTLRFWPTTEAKPETLATELPSFDVCDNVAASRLADEMLKHVSIKPGVVL